MLSAHATVAYLAIAVPALAAAVGGFVYWRRRGAGRIVANLLALAQTLSSPRSALGLLLLSDDRRAADELHYVYGSLALGALLAPWLYAPATGPRAARLVRRHLRTRRGARRASIHDRIVTGQALLHGHEPDWSAGSRSSPCRARGRRPPARGGRSRPSAGC